METILGAVIAAVAGAGTWAAGAWWSKREGLAEQRRTVARDMIRWRSEPRQFVNAANAVPAYFAGDREVMGLYRELATTSEPLSTEKLLQMVVLVARTTGADKDLQVSDLTHMISVR